MVDTPMQADVVVVGAGAGGLTAAAYLAALGRHVVVVDRGTVAGGNTSAFTHEGYEFDIGLHYLGDFRDGRPRARALLEPVGVDVRVREQDPAGFDTLLFEDMTFEVPKGLEAFRARLREAFPAEGAAIDPYLRRIAAVAEQADLPMPLRGVDGLRNSGACSVSLAARDPRVRRRDLLRGERDTNHAGALPALQWRHPLWNRWHAGTGWARAPRSSHTDRRSLCSGRKHA